MFIYTWSVVGMEYMSLTQEKYVMMALLSIDGCNNLCQIEYGWVCPDHIHCYIPACVPPTPLSSFCGNE